MPNLTHKIIDAVKPYKLSDALGLYIEVLPTGRKSWRCLYKEFGNHKTKTYGQYPEIGLAAARQMHNDFKKELPGSIKNGLPIL